MKEHTVGVIALGPSGNLQVGVIISLETGKLLNHPKGDYVLLLMRADVIKHIDRMARKSQSNGLVFGDFHANPDISDSNNVESNDDSDDPDYVPSPTGVPIVDDDDFATGFLCTRVQSSDECDWKKLSHLMKYLQQAVYLP